MATVAWFDIGGDFTCLDFIRHLEVPLPELYIYLEDMLDHKDYHIKHSYCAAIPDRLDTMLANIRKCGIERLPCDYIKAIRKEYMGGRITAEQIIGAQHDNYRNLVCMLSSGAQLNPWELSKARYGLDHGLVCRDDAYASLASYARKTGIQPPPGECDCADMAEWFGRKVMR